MMERPMTAEKLGCPVCGLEIQSIAFGFGGEIEVTPIEWSLKCQAKGPHPLECPNLKALLAGLPGKDG
jgi:hypothetical protein